MEPSTIWGECREKRQKGNGKRTQHQNVLRGGECSSGIRDSNILQPGKLHKGLPMRRRGKEPACQYKRHKFNPRAGKVLWRRKWPPHSRFLSGKPRGQRAPAGYSLWGPKESDTTEHARKRHPSLTRNAAPTRTSRRRAQFESWQCDSRPGSVAPGPAASASPGH